MHTRRGWLILLASAAISGGAIYLFRAYLPDQEIAALLVIAGTIIGRDIGERLWPTDEADHFTWSGLAVMAALGVLVVFWLMWVPGGLPVPRTMSVLPWRFEGDRVVGVALLVAFAGWTVLVHFVFEGLNRCFWRALGVAFTGITVIEGFVPGGLGTAVPVGLALFVLGAAGSFGPEFPQLLMRLIRGRWQPSGAYGNARFETDRGAAERAGLK
jgi:hypothetical protein